jgi:hypothetical protein
VKRSTKILLSLGGAAAAFVVIRAMRSSKTPSSSVPGMMTAPAPSSTLAPTARQIALQGRSATLHDHRASAVAGDFFYGF